MGVCAYRLWEEAKDKLPKEYFEEDGDVEGINEQYVTMYKRHTETTNKYLIAVTREYAQDPELIELYCNVRTFVIAYGID
jgi:hypothetical protein